MGRKSNKQIEDETRNEIFKVFNDVYSDNYISDSEFRYKVTRAHQALIYTYGDTVVDDYVERFIRIEKMING